MVVVRVAQRTRQTWTVGLRRPVREWLGVAFVGGAIVCSLQVKAQFDQALALEPPTIEAASGHAEPETTTTSVPASLSPPPGTPAPPRAAIDGPRDRRDGTVDAAIAGPTLAAEPDTENRDLAGTGTDPPLDSGPPLRGRIWVDPASSSQSWNAIGAVEGLLTFRGNPTRTYYGRGPVPQDPVVSWQVELGCSYSAAGNERKRWCGSGWTGQPAVFRHPGTDEWTVAVGAYNRAVNFFDPVDGRRSYPPYYTDDIIKGSITIDPDGYPLLYTGSRDGRFHVVALDRDWPESLWTLEATNGSATTLWNDDWDSSALVISDYLIVGGENSRFYVVKLNRQFNSDNQVHIEPEVVVNQAGWDRELLEALADLEVSIENSVAVSGNTVYFANSGGLIQGWDLSPVSRDQPPEQTFRYWAGDDIDASIVIDSDGALYVTAEFDRKTERSRELGQIFKLDPTKPDDPLVWSVQAHSPGRGVWATPALYGDVVIVPTDGGQVLGLDRFSGDVHWRLELPGPLWSSPVVVDDILIQGDCDRHLNAFLLHDGAAGAELTLEPNDGTGQPELLWSLELTGCIESTPAVWNGQIFVGSRSGRFYGISDRSGSTLVANR